MTPAALAPTVRGAVDAAVARLAAAGVETPRVDAEWLLAGLVGVGRAGLAADGDRELAPSLAARYEAMIARRARREPLQQILGWEEFHGLRFTVTPDVLVPRPETERLVEWALALAPAAASRAIDVGTGSGCVACALAASRPDLRVIALDASAAAATVARRNVEALGLSARVGVVVSDLFAALDDRAVDLIVANPPYVPTPALDRLQPEVVDHEPRLALDGGADGLRLIRRLVADAPARLTSGGWLVLETFGGDQARAVADLMRRAGLTDVAIRSDLAAVDRFVAGRVA